VSGVIAALEHVVKKPVWDCRMCGQCVLHSTGMTCPMTCPKTLRNGPCGGVREDGHCEVKPEMRCVWVKAEERSRTLPLLPPKWREELNHTRPPVNNQLQGTSSWINLVNGKDRRTPAGWAGQDRPGDDDADRPEPSLGEYEGPMETPFHPAPQQSGAASKAV
jgi:hypothetical protein